MCYEARPKQDINVDQREAFVEQIKAIRTHPKCDEILAELLVLLTQLHQEEAQKKDAPRQQPEERPKLREATTLQQDYFTTEHPNLQVGEGGILCKEQEGGT